MKKNVLLAWIGLMFWLAPFVVNAQVPNIILFLVDDQGWTGTSVKMDQNINQSASSYYQTPNLEDLAIEGMTFSQAYAPAPKCSPSRSSILVGQTTAKTHFTNTSTNTTQDSILLDVPSNKNIFDSLITFPEVLKSLGQGYTTAHYGKWHLGTGGPENHGFDRSDGNTSNSDGSQGSMVQNNPKKIFSITDSAAAFLTDAKQSGNPFFLQISHYAVHDPNQTQPLTIADWGDTVLHPPGVVHEDSTYGAMTFNLDQSLGMLLDTLAKLGLDSNTYFVYFSDNGASKSQSNNRPLSRGKLSLDEGGIRVPLVIRGPSIAQNSRSEVAVVGYDFFPTVLDWVQGNLSSVPANVEGGSMKSILTNGGTGVVNRANSLIFHSPHYDVVSYKDPRSAIIKDNYKMIVNYETGDFTLFDLDTDIEENLDISGSQPVINHSLCLELRDYLKSVAAQMPTLNPGNAANPGLAPDADADGLNDEWEFRELLTSAYDSTADPDNDGLSNGQEQFLNTDPYVFDSLTTNIEKDNSPPAFALFPNPAAGFITVNGMLKDDQLILLDGQGRVVIKSNGVSEVNIGELTPGLHFVEIWRNGIKVWVDKLIVVK